MIELGQEVYPLFFALYECGGLRSTEWCHGAGRRALGLEESPGMESYLFHQLDMLSKNQQVELHTSHLKL